MRAKELIEKIDNGVCNDIILDLYVDEVKLDYQKQRYIEAINQYIKAFGNADVVIFSAPGRSEIGGNHTDHQHGEVLAVSINLDAIAVVGPVEGNEVKIISEGYGTIIVDLNQIECAENEKGTTISLIKGVLCKILSMGYKVGGFQAYITSDVLIGAGLSSSAAYETLIGTIISGLYNDMKITPIEIAIIGQFAENVYFGKPCGLMDQMACSVGNLVYINFADVNEPKVLQVTFDMNEYDYSLCITDTKGSHADLTDEYAAIPEEMKKIAGFFRKEVLLGITENDIYKNINELREMAGDRAVLRALHFISENERVKEEVQALKNNDIEKLLEIMKESGNSSFKYLQNIYSNKNVNCQNVSLALAISELTLKDKGVCRVHGGGFAGTIQAFVKNEVAEEYQERMDGIFGKGACNILKIRKYGAIRVL